MATLFRRLVAIVAVLTLTAVNLAACAGWQATPEARMACCQDEASCPMHDSESHGSGSNHQVTQAQADGCCATSERSESATTRVPFVSSGTGALVATGIPVAVNSMLPALQGWRAFVPIPVSPVPKHLLLSVLLV